VATNARRQLPATGRRLHPRAGRLVVNPRHVALAGLVVVAGAVLLAKAVGAVGTPPPASPEGAVATVRPRPPATPSGPCGDLQRRIDMAPAGSTLDLVGCVYSTSATIDKPLTLKGATISVARSSIGLLVTADRVTLDGLTISGTQSSDYEDSEIGISVNATAEDPVTDLTIRGCDIGDLGGSAVNLIHVVDVTISDCHVHDVAYAGLRVLSGRGGLIEGNTVQRIGMAGTGPGANAYGIDLEAIASGDLAKDPPTSDIVVQGNTVEDVPTWHALDTHNGLRITFSGNIVRRAMRAIFITTDSLGNRSRDITVTGNQLFAPPRSVSGAIAVTLYDVDGVRVTDNAISRAWRGPPVYDYQGRSTDVVVSGNRRMP
jgi:hypothetical protein